MNMIHKMSRLLMMAAGLVLCLWFSACEQKEETSGGYTDPYLEVKITPLALELYEWYNKADALVVQWRWVVPSEFDNNPDVTFTLELAEADTDFESPYYCILGKNELQGERWFKVQELNKMLVTNGVLGNGEAGDIEARIIASESSYRGCRSEVTRFTVQTYYLDPNQIPPYERIWFVGDFTKWRFVEMKRSEENPFLFTHNITFRKEDCRDQTYEFKFAVHEWGSYDENGKELTWWDMYKPPYENAPITESKVVQVQNDVLNDFKWVVEEKYLEHSFRIELNITPGEESMKCFAIDGSEVLPPDEGGDDDGDEGGDSPVVPPVDAEPFSISFNAIDCETGGSANKVNGRVEGINAWRESYINIEFDAPYNGEYTLISTIDCWDVVEFSFHVTDGHNNKTLQIAKTDVSNVPFEHSCRILLQEGLNTVKISGGSGGYKEGWAPNFRKFVITNGIGNFPGGGAEGNDQGDF